MEKQISFMRKLLSKTIRKISISKIQQLEKIEYDICIVGGGPAGLSSAIRLKQLAKQKNLDLSVCLLEKGSQIGSHILSGNCFNPKALYELFPNWEELDTPIKTKVQTEKILYLSKQNSIQIPNVCIRKSFLNHNNYIISLGQLTKWLQTKAEEVGVDIFTGFAADDFIESDSPIQTILGVLTKERGISKNNQKKENYQSGIALLSKQLILAEGARGNISEQIISKFNLRSNSDPQIYGLGIKELWDIDIEPGLLIHTVGYPNQEKYGGGFFYTMKGFAHIGYIIGLDYKNPNLSTYEEFQKWKNHPSIRSLLQKGQCIQYGARVINEGGYYSIPKLTFPGGLLIGCSAGFVDVMRVKGSHNAMKTGMLAAEEIIAKIEKNSDKSKLNQELYNFSEIVQNSWVGQDLKQTRNFKGGFKFGTIPGLMHGAFLQMTKGKEFYNL